MAITQLSAFLENKPGSLYEAVAAITEAGVNIRALSVAETIDFGVLRMIVSDIQKTKDALSENVIIRDTPVVAVKMEDTAGALMKILKVLKNAGINIEYVYAFTGAVQGSAYVALRVDDPDSAESLLAGSGMKTLEDADLTEIF